LRRHQIALVADVRSVPYSRMQPQFNREALIKDLEKCGIEYVFLGAELGARSNDRACYEKGQVQYRRLAQTSAFHRGIERLRDESGRLMVALMCAEREPLECHRTVLVGRELQQIGIPVVHIHADGHVESHIDAMRRLIRHFGLHEEDLFRSRDELMEEAYEKQESRIAYVDEQLVQESHKAKT
jgi:uncharacterized protein (DUF488 family)